MKQKLLTAGVLLASTMSPLAQAGISWDPNGSAGGQRAIDLGSFDWSQSSFVAKGGNTAIANFVANSFDGGTRSTEFTVYSHARLGSTTNSASIPNTPSGLNSSYEYTMVLGFTEKVTKVFPAGGDVSDFGRADFKTDFTKPSFLEIYYDTARNSNALTGHGFKDGQLVLRAELAQDTTGSFELSSDALVPLDGFGANNYDGGPIDQMTNPGFGTNNTLVFKAIQQDFAFFKDAIDNLGIKYTNISLGLPYLQVDPSDCYVDTAEGSLGLKSETECDNVHVDGLLDPATQPLGVGFGGFVPDASPNNTTLSGSDANPDFVAQTDYNASIDGTPVPEPTSLFMLGAGLLGMFRMTSRRQRG